MSIKLSKMLPSAGVLAIFLAAPAYAQDEAASADEEIIVTGTSIRGIAPAGSNVVGLSHEDVVATGANSATELLAEIPQANSFNQLPQPGGGPGGNFNSVIQASRVSLRPLPGDQAGGSMQTLILVDGHRLAPAGLGTRVYVDPNVIAPTMLERVEAIVDGGSAVYGSDAFTGAINFITRRSFDGVEASARYGFGDSYETWGHTITAGTDWGSGSLYGAYNYTQSDALFGRDRDWIHEYTVDPNDGDPPSGRTCAEPTVTPNVGADVYSGDGTVLDAPNVCDLSDDRSFYPRQYRYSLMAGFSQDLSETVRFDLRGHISRQDSIAYSGTFGQTVTIRDGVNPFFNGAIPGTQHSVAFDFSPVVGPTAQKQTTNTDAWQITPELTWDFGDDWQVRGLLSHGQTELGFRNATLNTTAVTAAAAGMTPSTALNPYDIASTNSDLLASFFGETRGRGQTHFSNARVIADGPLFSLPAGDLRAAIGAEHLKTDISQVIVTSTTATGSETNADQDVSAVFAELQAPIISAEMGVPLVHALALQVSVRNDRYNDFGETTNAAYGLTYEPVDWITFRANYSEAFLAPTPVEQSAITNVTGSVIGEPGVADALLPDGSTLPDGAGTLSLGGSLRPLGPQTAENYSFGLDFDPPIVDGLRLSATFWHVGMTNRLSTPVACAPVDFPTCFYPFFQPDFVYFVDPTADEINQFLDADDSGADLDRFRPGAPGGVEVELIIDNRNRNLGNVTVEGWDIAADYFHETSWGSWDARINGTIYNLQRQNNGGTTPWQNRNLTSAQYFFTATAGANVGDFRGQASVNYTPERDNNNSPTGNPEGGEVDAYYPLDLFFSYDVEGSGITDGLQLTMNVNNVFDQEPPNPEVFTGASYGVGSVFNLGRVVQFGVSKRF